jgi:hypothetical protein
VEQQGLDEGIPTPDARNEWDLRLNDAVPLDLGVQMGGGVSNLDLDSLSLRGLSIDMAAGATTVDLTGDWERDLSALVRGGAGEVTVLFPSQVGVRVNAGTRLGRVTTDGLQEQGEGFVNDAYGDSEVTLEVRVQGGVGQIILKVVQGYFDLRFVRSEVWYMVFLVSCVSPDPGSVGVDARASEEPVEVAVGCPGPCGAAEDAEDDVEDRVGQGVAYGEAHHV